MELMRSVQLPLASNKIWKIRSLKPQAGPIFPLNSPEQLRRARLLICRWTVVQSRRPNRTPLLVIEGDFGHEVDH